MTTRRTALKAMAGALRPRRRRAPLGHEAGPCAGSNAEARRHVGTSRSAPRRRTTIRTASDTYATLHFAAPFYSTLLRFNLEQVPAGRRRSGAILDRRAGLDDLHVQAATQREIPRRHDADLGGRESDLRAAAQSADGRGLDPQGDLRRHRHDRDA